MDDGIGEMAMKVQKKIVNRVDMMVRGMVAELAEVVKKQYDQQVPIIVHNSNNTSISHNNNKNIPNSTPLQQQVFPLLPSPKLYNYLSKLNELQQF